MKSRSSVKIVFLIGLFVLPLYNCKKEIIKNEDTLPTVVTKEITAISQTSAITGGIITFNASSDIIARGVCWSTSENPTIADNKTFVPFELGNNDFGISGLTDNTTYFCRAYVTNSEGTVYGNQLSFKTPPATGTVADIDGNVYHTVTIGTQIWMIENLKTTRFNDGKAIPNVADNNEWSNLKTPGYCWYNNDEVNKNPYGGLYNWYAVNTGKLCPVGWHVPTNEEWTTLTTFVGGESCCGSKLIEPGAAHWENGFGSSATNETGFTALPGGSRAVAPIAGFMGQLGSYGLYLSSSSAGYPPEETESVFSRYFSTGASSWVSSKKAGLSVRCLKD